MGQIVGGAAKPKRCNLNKLSQLETPAAGEHILISSDNSMNAAGQGIFDCYIVGDGTTAATELELKSLVDDGAFDISAYRATGNVLAKYAGLAAALDGGNNIPEAIRKGGISVKFVQSSDNKYVQFFNTKNEWSANTDYWQKVNLESEVNLINDEVFGTDGNLTPGYYLNSSNELVADSNYAVSDYIELTSAARNITAFYAQSGTLAGYYLISVDNNNNIIDVVNESPTIGIGITLSASATKFRFTFKTGYAAYATVGGVRVYDAVIPISGLSGKVENLETAIDEQDEKISTLNTKVERTDSKLKYCADTELVVLSRNLFDKSKMISGKYIGYTGTQAGTLINISNDAIKVSDLIPVEAGKKYYLTRKAGLAHCAQRFVAADGETPLLPLNIDGTNYSWLNNNNPSWAFLAPANAAYFQFQVTWTDSGDPDLSQFEEGTKGTSIVPYSAEKQLVYNELPTKVKELVNDTTKKNIVRLNFATRATCYIISDFDTNNNIKLDFRLNQGISGIGYSSNPCFNFLQTELINKESGNETVVHYNTDDVCPANYNRNATVGNTGYIGANHAAQCVSVCTVSNHGKTVADIGSKWSNGTYEFTIVAVIDANTLWLIGDNFATYPLYSFRKASTNDTMVHVSGATHTGSFTVTSVDPISQWWYAYGMPTTKVYLDGKLVTESGEYEFDEMKICEEYDVLNPASVLSLVQAAVGTFTNNPNPALFANTADKMVRHSNTYTFTSAAQCFVATSFTTYQNIDDAWFGLTQQEAVAGNNKKLYIPEAVVGSVDYRTIVNLADAPNHIMKSGWEDESFPPNRYLQYSDLVAFNCGYLPISAGNDRLNAIGDDGVAIYISSTTKMYPNLFYGKSMTAYENYAGVAWRTYIPRAKVNAGGVISVNQFTYRGKHYVVADFNAVGIYEIELQSECAGKEVSVLRKRDNVTLLTKVPSDTLMVKVDTDTIMYGFIVAVFE